MTEHFGTDLLVLSERGVANIAELVNKELCGLHHLVITGKDSKPVEVANSSRWLDWLNLGSEVSQLC